MSIPDRHGNDGGADAGVEVLVKLSLHEHRALSAAARDRGMSLEAWLMSTTSAALAGKPLWNREETVHLGHIVSALRQIDLLLRGIPPGEIVEVLRCLYQGLARQYARLIDLIRAGSD
jgi:hypothetical protein